MKLLLLLPRLSTCNYYEIRQLQDRTWSYLRTMPKLKLGMWRAYEYLGLASLPGIE